QSGQPEEYSRLSSLLQALWSKLAEIGSPAPVLYTVPGNHDLQRPNAKDPTVILLRELSQRPELPAGFWEQPDSPYRRVVDKAFASYRAWWQDCPHIGRNALREGLLTGDFSATIEKQGARLGIIGLNTTFLQLTGGDFQQKLMLKEDQFHR